MIVFTPLDGFVLRLVGAPNRGTYSRLNSLPKIEQCNTAYSWPVAGVRASGGALVILLERNNEALIGR